MIIKETAYDKKVTKLARALVEFMLTLPAEATTTDTLAIWQRIKGTSPEVIGDAFTTLDNEPGRFHAYLTWHPKLRRLRNDPINGRKLFKLFQGA